MRRFLSISLALLLACACTEKLANPSADISLRASQETLEARGGSLFLSVRAEGEWAIQILEGAEWAELSVRTGRGSKNSVVLSYSANTDADVRTLRLALDAQGTTKGLTLRQPVYVGPAPGPGPVGPDVPGGDGGYGKAVAAQHWLELPQTSATDAYDFFTRSASLSGRTIRNYSFYWDYSDRVSLWVAYPLCGAFLGSQSRTDAWGYDPLLPASRQQNVSGGYRESTLYARGHQLPSADRTVNYSLNASTFYGTNMTPQRHAFNEGVWATLEGKVRSWAQQSDTLYVVTGCVVAGARNVAHDRSDNSITVPTAYFKAILRYKKDSTLGHGGYMGAAFWYDHEYDASGIAINWAGRSFSKTQSLSINELEQKLGYTMFVNLPERVGATAATEIKSEKPANVNWWW